ncbi:MAG: septal ring lytic transglycosylase RlpA family protein [Azonexus sp.]|nr:septal ring lytic transglycosylase RlpA family protein [Azonexus sp.]
MPALPYPLQDAGAPLDGLASYYGGKFHGRKTASGERYDKQALTAASNRFPLNTRLAVRRTATNACVVVRNTDRMHARHELRIIDLSVAGAKKLGMLLAGVVGVQVKSMPQHLPANDEQACLAAFAAPPVPCVECGQPPIHEENAGPFFSDP